MSARLMRPFALVLLLAALSVCSMADDLHPPYWRGLPGTTYAKWEFSTPDINPLPDEFVNPNGIPTTEVFPGHEWLPEYGGRFGVWPLSGLIVVDIPNFPRPNPLKVVRVQVTWSSPSAYGEPDVDEILFGRTGELIDRVPVAPDQGVQWWHDTYRLTIIPNPPREVIRIQGAIWVDELVIDTSCVPEPSSLAALCGSLGIFGLVLRRRR
jgi:hypothetical protein